MVYWFHKEGNMTTNEILMIGITLGFLVFLGTIMVRS